MNNAPPLVAWNLSVVGFTDVVRLGVKCVQVAAHPDNCMADPANVGRRTRSCKKVELFARSPRRGVCNFEYRRSQS